MNKDDEERERKQLMSESKARRILAESEARRLGVMIGLSAFKAIEATRTLQELADVERRIMQQLRAAMLAGRPGEPPASLFEGDYRKKINLRLSLLLGGDRKVCS